MLPEQEQPCAQWGSHRDPSPLSRGACMLGLWVSPGFQLLPWAKTESSLLPPMAVTSDGLHLLWGRGRRRNPDSAP